MKVILEYPNPHSTAKFQFWASPDGTIGNDEEPRWYWHRKVNGRITDSGSYASRRALRRALKQRVAKETVEHG